MTTPTLLDLLQDPELLDPSVVLVITVNEGGETINARATDLAEAMMLLKGFSTEQVAKKEEKEKKKPPSMAW